MKRTNTQKGITLIALIITIVVLLILAVVAIGAVKNSKIVEHAQDAKSKYTIAQEKEQIGLALSEWSLEKVIPEKNPVFKNVIENALKGQIEPIQGNDDGPLTITFTKTGNVYEVKKDGTIIPVTQEVINPDEPVDPENPEDIVTVASKAFDLNTAVGEGKIGILSPNDNEFAIFSETSIVPVSIGIEIVDLAALEKQYSIDIEIPENIKYKKAIASQELFVLFLISEDGEKIYYAKPDSNGKVIFGESTYVEVSSSIDASKYYHEDVYYYFPEYTKTTTNNNGYNSLTYTEVIVSLANSKQYSPELNYAYSTVFVNKGTVSAGETVVVDVENGTVTIREGAQKLELDIGGGYTFNAYIQDGKFYYANRTGTPYNFINTALLPTE